MNLINKGDHIYFELIDNNSSDYNYYEFTYKYVRYICRCNYDVRYVYDLYYIIINKINNHYGIKNINIYHCKGHNYKNVNIGDVVEVISRSGMHSYYVVHKLSDISIDILKYKLPEYNLENLKYSLKRVSDSILITKNYNYVDNKINTDDSLISDLIK